MGGGLGRGLGKLFVVCCCVMCLSLGAPQQEISLPTTGSATVTLPDDDSAPIVALTFDDGPMGERTERLLEGLALREVVATFFLVGDHIEGNEGLIQRMAEEGHQIGLHSMSHIYLSDLSYEDYWLEVERPRAMLSQLLPLETFWLRPPYGIFDTATQRRTTTPIILWSLDPKDWEIHDAEAVAQTILSQVKDGDIILLHDIYDSTVDATFIVVDALLQQGYDFVTVEQLLTLKNIDPQPGEVYTGNYPH